jgi:hypothetical protein
VRFALNGRLLELETSEKRVSQGGLFIHIYATAQLKLRKINELALLTGSIRFAFFLSALLFLIDISTLDPLQ